MTSSDWYYGLPRTLDNIHRVASLTRDRLSLEAWRTLNDFYAGRRWQASAMPKSIGESLGLLDDGLRVPAAFHGLTHENMTRNYGWSFLDMGRRLSRAAHLSELLLGIFGKAGAGGRRHRAACRSCWSWPTASSPTARAIALAPVLPLVLDLLLVDESNLRSVGVPARGPVASASIRCRSPATRAAAHRGAAHRARPAGRELRVAQRGRPRRRSVLTARRATLETLLGEQVDALPHAVGRHRRGATSI